MSRGVIEPRGNQLVDGLRDGVFGTGQSKDTGRGRAGGHIAVSGAGNLGELQRGAPRTFGFLLTPVRMWKAGMVTAAVRSGVERRCGIGRDADSEPWRM